AGHRRGAARAGCVVAVGSARGFGALRASHCHGAGVTRALAAARKRCPGSDAGAALRSPVAPWRAGQVTHGAPSVGLLLGASPWTALHGFPPTPIKMRTFIAGGTGLVGTRLVAKLLARGDHVVVLTRRPEIAREKWGETCTIVTGDPTQAGPWM